METFSSYLGPFGSTLFQICIVDEYFTNESFVSHNGVVALAVSGTMTGTRTRTDIMHKLFTLAVSVTRTVRMKAIEISSIHHLKQFRDLKKGM